MTRNRLLLGGWLLLPITMMVASDRARGAEPAPTETPTTPAQALAAWTLPEGFRASLFAAEPDVTQPIAIATDPRGRLWVAENETYADRAVNFDLARHDRIVILEDADHDGKAEKRTVFWDKAQRLTSVEVGFGGVWALCPPRLLFLPDRNGDDVPDGEPEVVLDGWDDDSVRHNIANGLRWGPDGWLYGRHGILATSLVGPPGTPKDQRAALNCAIWRWHPTRHTFEVVCRGTTNSWGMDWDERGELFFINTVIGHLWHAVPGAHFQRMYGEDFDPHLYRLLGQTADHYHWDTGELWSDIRQIGVSPTTDRAGGGHAHSGLMIYQGGNWPDAYRGSVFAINLHGRRLNRDTLERKGAGFVGKHAPDLMRTSDPWFRALDMIYGPDGGVYINDWSDVGECHENDGVHRASGRIYKITFGQPPRPTIGDLSALSDRELVNLQAHSNEWHVRQSRRLLQDRSAAGKPMGEVREALLATFDTASETRLRLRAMWALFVTEGASEAWLRKALDHKDESVRAWAVRLLVDRGRPSAEVVQAFKDRASADPSGLVLLYLASALQRMAEADRWIVAEALASRSEFADDPTLPLMVWYGIEPVVPKSPAKAVALAASTRMPTVGTLVARRLTEDLARAPEPVDWLLGVVNVERTPARQRSVLTGMVEALRGWRKAPTPATWEVVGTVLASTSDRDVRALTRELSVVFGDGRALDELRRLLTSKTAETKSRRDALQALVEARAEGLTPLLRSLAEDRDLGSDAIRGMGAVDDPGTSRFLLTRFPRLRPESRVEAIVALASRPSSARDLLEAVAQGVVDRRLVSPFQVRQMQGFPDLDIRRRTAELWPELKAIGSAKRERIDRLKSQLDTRTLAGADLAQGRLLFTKSCASCHVLFGEGGKIGPDLTGAQRSSLDYLLENIVDPSATLAADFRMSTIALNDGRILDGIVGARTGRTLIVQTPTERLVLNQADIEEIRPSDRSLMPDGQLDVLGAEQVRDLVGYLMSPRQVPLPEAGREGR